MRKFYTFLTAILLTISVCLPWQVKAQSPEKMSYQAVIRDASDNLVTNTSVGMQISILQESVYGASVYIETQTPTTNANGLVSIEIGGTDATVVSGDFSAIDWANSTYFIKTETDPTGGSTYTITGTSQLLSVPYALHAKKAEDISGTIISSKVSDFQTTVTNNADVLANTAKNSYPSADQTKVSNLSGTNTGDETTATIKTKLGITTLSGSNTGDQTLAGLGGVASNTAITGATKTKITYDAKGLVTAGTDATTADILASANKNYVTDAQLTVIGNTSGTNSGDNAVNNQYSGLVTNATHTGDVTGSEALTLATVNSDVGTFNNITINAKGLATAGNNVSYLTSETDPTVKAINGIVKSDGTTISAATAGTDYLTPTGSAELLTEFPLLNQNTTGSAASFTGSLAGQVTGTQDATVVENSAVIGKVLTGYVSGAGHITASDNILQAIQKLNGNNPEHYVGQSYGGGIIFYLDASGRHGLIAATEDQSIGTPWRSSFYSTTNAVRDGIGAGMYNTERIIANQGTGSYAAQLCANYQGGGYGDWYLPSKYELNLLFIARFMIGGLTNYTYWSSTEASPLEAWLQSFQSGAQLSEDKAYDTHYVRAVRAF